MKSERDYVSCIVITNRDGMNDTIPLDHLLSNGRYKDIQRTILMHFREEYGIRPGNVDEAINGRRVDDSE